VAADQRHAALVVRPDGGELVHERGEAESDRGADGDVLAQPLRNVRREGLRR